MTEEKECQQNDAENGKYVIYILKFLYVCNSQRPATINDDRYQ